MVRLGVGQIYLKTRRGPTGAASQDGSQPCIFVQPCNSSKQANKPLQQLLACPTNGSCSVQEPQVRFHENTISTQLCPSDRAVKAPDGELVGCLLCFLQTKARQASAEKSQCPMLMPLGQDDASDKRLVARCARISALNPRRAVYERASRVHRDVVDTRRIYVWTVQRPALQFQTTVLHRFSASVRRIVERRLRTGSCVTFLCC